MRATELLSALDDLPYADRVRLIAEHARRLRGTPELTALITALDTGATGGAPNSGGTGGTGDSGGTGGTPDHSGTGGTGGAPGPGGTGDPDGTFARTVGLQLAQIAGDVSHITKLLGDPLLQWRALSAAKRGVPVSDDALETLYSDAPAALRTKILGVVRKTQRQELAIRLIDEHRDRWGDHAAAGLLSSVDTPTVDRLLPELGYTLTAGGWARLAARHPAAVLDYASRTMPDGFYRTEWWDSVGYGVVEAIDHYPERVVELIHAAMPRYALPTPVTKIIGKLADLDPAGLLQILLAPDRVRSIRSALTPALRERLHRYADEDLVAIGRALWPNLEDLLADLPPSRRETIFTAVTAPLELGQTILADSLLDVLPRSLRHEQARRMLTLPKISEDLHTRWQLTAQLPYDEAFALLEPEIGRAAAADRAGVYRAVIASAGRSREPALIMQALTWATRIRNEQDPVRQAVLGAAAALPPSLLTDEHVDALQTLLTDALEARDLSWESRADLGELAETAVRQGALGNKSALLDWGFRAHGRLSEHSGNLRLAGLIDGLPRGREAGVYEALRPSIDAAAKRGEFALAIAVGQAFGRHGWGNAHLHEVLKQAVWSNKEHATDSAAALWLEPPTTRAERTGRVIDYDVRMVRWSPIWAAVTDVRTDLLDKVFAKPKRIDSFKKGHHIWPLPTTTLRRWLPRQRSRYAGLIADTAIDTSMPESSRASAVSTLGRLPGVGRAAIEPFLSSDSVLLQEAALGALAWTDQPALALPVLLSHAGDDRARVALSAASRAARFARPSLLAELFRPVLVGEGVKVTARKEAARLLGVLRAPGAGEVLADAWTDAHRDVRAAITSVASQHLLREPASWALLQEAVHDSPATATALMLRSPLSMALQYRSRYADLLIAATNRPETSVVGAALRSLAEWAPYNPAVAPVCAAFVTDLTNRSKNWVDAATALSRIVAGGQPRDDLISVIRLLIRLETKPGVPNAEADRDHPARQRLTILMSWLSDAVDYDSRQALLDATAELVGPEYLALRVPPLIWAMETTAPIVELTAIADLIADRPLLIAASAEQLHLRLASAQGHLPASVLLAPAIHLAGTGRAVDGHFSLALIAAATDNKGWPPEWRALLVDLRNHPVADVRYAALDLRTANEF